MPSAAAAAGVVRPSKPPKKPRDMRLRDCFEITPVEGGFDRISCRYCAKYRKVLQKFNPTKARVHLTTSCDGTDESLRRALLSSTQAARKSLQGGEAATAAGGGGGRTGGYEAAGGFAALVPGGDPAADPSSAKRRKLKDRSRPCPVYLSFHTDADDAAGLVSSLLRLRHFRPAPRENFPGACFIRNERSRARMSRPPSKTGC